MDTALKMLPPSQAWEEVERRSLAVGVAGFVFIGTLQAAGAVPAIYRQTLAPVSGSVAAFLTALTLFVAYYHDRWSFGVFGAALTLTLPYCVNLAWIHFTGRSLLYPVAALVLLGVISLWFIHRRISGPQWDDDLEEALIRKMMEEFESNLTLADRIMWFCIVVGLMLLLVLLLR
jgi:hypothetical protein